MQNTSGFVKTLYLNIFSGISGDMFIGALLDLGLDLGQLEAELGKLRLDGYHLHSQRLLRGGIEGVKFDVHMGAHHAAMHRSDSSAEPQSHRCSDADSGSDSQAPIHGHPHAHSHAHSHMDSPAPLPAPVPDYDDHHHSHSGSQVLAGSSAEEGGHEHEHEHGRGFSEIRELIRASALSDWVKERAVSVFRRIGEAESKVHGMPIDQVHFHEVGALDSIVDIVGGCIALEMLGKPAVLASEAVEGQGWVSCAHGRFPVPTAATLEILGARGVALTQCEEPGELITPTGAALLAEFVTEFAPMRNLVAEKIGYGVGTRENKTRPNVLRAVLGVVAGARQGGNGSSERDRIAVLESNLDDVPSEVLGHFVEVALNAGALDVFYVPISMKKSRPGVLLSVLCAEADADRLVELILSETSAFGVRQSVCERRKLRRESCRVMTRYGEAAVKLGWLGDRLLQASPEFEICRRLAQAAGVPVRLVQEAARAAAEGHFKS